MIFRQLKEYGQLGIADFDITINQVPLKHRLFNYRLPTSDFRLPTSGWSFAQVVYGGESFSALVTGLQRAFRASGGVPNELRTDNLSAAYNNSGSQAIFAEQFSGFIDHYQLKASRNNRGIAHENGAIESPNNHLKISFAKRYWCGALMILRLRLSMKSLSLVSLNDVTVELSICSLKSSDNYRLYRHLRAFRTYQWREQLLPSEDYRLIWKYVDKHLTADEASYYLVKLLHLAHKSDQEGALGRFVLTGIDTGILPTIIDSEARYMTDEKWVMTPHVQQHPLSSYQAILDEVKCHAS